MKLRLHFIWPLLLASAAPCFAAGPAYTFLPLPDLGYGSAAEGINNQGQVVGSAFLPDGTYHAVLWSRAGGMTDLGTLPGYQDSAANGINSAGQIVGDSQADGGSTIAGFLWQPQTGMVNPSSGTGLILQFDGINNSGEAFGSARTSPDQPGFGILYTPATGVTPVNIPGVPVDSVLAVNNEGQMLLSSPPSPFTLFDVPGQAPAPIQGTGITQATALALNDSGAAVGFSSAGEQANTHAFIWTQPGGMIDLTPGANQGGMATAINTEGDVVGSDGIGNAPGTPFLYEGGVMYDLGALGASAAGWTYLLPEAISDSGVIVGVGQYNGLPQAFELLPIVSPTEAPEPASMGVLALSSLTLLSRRRRMLGK